MVNEETRASLVAEHYRDSCKTLAKQLATRNKELVWLFGLLALTMLNAYYPDLFPKVLPKTLGLEGTVSVPLPIGFSGFILLFAITLLLGDIYNLSVVIERSVLYLVNLETALCLALGEGAIARYMLSVKNRPRFLTEARYVFSFGFAALNSALTLAIIWGNAHSRISRWFVGLDIALCLGILYMSVTFVRGFVEVEGEIPSR